MKGFSLSLLLLETLKRLRQGHYFIEALQKAVITLVQYCCNCQSTVGIYALENFTRNSAQASTFSWTVSWIQQGDASQCFLSWANRIRENYNSTVVETTMKLSLFKQKLSKVSSRDDANKDNKRLLHFNQASWWWCLERVLWVAWGLPALI